MSNNYKKSEELIKELDEMRNHWDKTNEVYSLTDFEEIIRELTLREGE